MRIFPTIYEVEIFREKGYTRKKCASCGRSFWTLNPDSPYCGDQPCVSYTFIDNPPTQVKLGIIEAREKFLSFFEKNGHKRIGKYPIVARWRDDVYLVGASIYDFQPWVTDGIIPPPANPLTISQPCVRFTDIDLIGKSGRHLTEFEMMAHHAFNSPEKHVYWNNETVAFCYRFFTEELGIPPEKINFIEDMWAGGGNAGEDFEVVVGGIELATLVFMHYKQIDGELHPLKIQTVDTGYGLERIVWLTSRTPTIYDAVFGSVIQKLRSWTGVKPPEEKIFVEASKLAGLMELKAGKSLRELRAKIAEKVGIPVVELEKIMVPMETIYAIADFSRTLIFMLGDGVVPSNAEAGYLARLLIRRILRNMHSLSLEVPLTEVLSLQLNEVSKSFPEYKEKADIIFDMVRVEEERFKETLKRGKQLVKKVVTEAKAKGLQTIPTQNLITLYDSHGLTPDYVSQLAKEMNVKVEVPDDFYSQVAKLHEKTTITTEKKVVEPEIEEKAKSLPSTRLLFYEQPYLKEFKAKVLDVLADKYVVLDVTCFYPEGGGQPADTGVLKWDGFESRIVDVQKIGNVVVHKVEGKTPVKGVEVTGLVDWDRRLGLMKNHTATHILLGAARRVLGDHVWQAGATKGVERSRLDISHYLRLTDEQVQQIEKLANEVISKNLSVKTFWLPREVAESRYGFRIYQGGVVPGKELRIVETEGWDVEACGGTHCKTTGEVGLIKIIRTERIQDGVERIFFAVGSAAINHIQQTEAKLKGIAKAIGCPVEETEKAVKTLIGEVKSLRKDIERLKETLAKQLTSTMLKDIKQVGRVKLLGKITSLMDVETAIKAASELVKLEPSLVVVFMVPEGEKIRLVVMVGEEALNVGVNAGKLAGEVAKIAGGGGGGKPDFGQGGNLNPEKALEALEAAEKILREKFFVEG